MQRSRHLKRRIFKRSRGQYKNYKQALKSAETDEERENIREGLDRLVLGKQILVQLEVAKSADTLARAQPSIDRLDRLLDRLDATYDGEEAASSSNGRSAKTSLDVNLTTTHAQTELRL